MNNEQIILQHDLLIMEEMVNGMAEYLTNHVRDWSIPRTNMPKLTIGGYLMREHRLCALQDRFQVGRRERLLQVKEKFEEVLVDKVIIFEKRCHEELRERIKEWVIFMRDLSGRSEQDANRYASAADTRVVISCLIEKLQSRPYQLEASVLPEIKTLDANLRRRWSSGKFIWEAVWKSAYPEDQYWWLYGSPKAI